MKYKGRTIAGANLLTILGVVCFATMLVTAAILLSNTITINRTVHGSVTLGAVTTFNGGTVDKTDLPSSDPMMLTEYDFAVPVTGTTTESATIVITITGNGVTGTDSVNMWSYSSSGPSWVTMTESYNAGVPSLTFSFPITLSTSLVNYGFEIEYMNAGTFNISIVVNSG